MRLWFFERNNPTFRISKAGHIPEPLALTPTTEFARGLVPDSTAATSPGLAYADVQLEPDSRYYIDLGTGSFPGSTIGHWVTTEAATWAPVDLSSADPMLIFAESEEAPQPITNCSIDPVNEVAALYLRRPEGAAYVVAKPEYPSQTQASTPIALFTDPTVEDLKFTFWTIDQGAPTCVALEAYGPDGVVQDRHKVCNVDHCQNADLADVFLPRSHWESGGGNSCRSGGCRCAATPASNSGLLFLLIGFVGLCSRRVWSKTSR